jgi:cathepsin D
VNAESEIVATPENEALQTSIKQGRDFSSFQRPADLSKVSQDNFGFVKIGPIATAQIKLNDLDCGTLRAAGMTNLFAWNADQDLSEKNFLFIKNSDGSISMTIGSQFVSCETENCSLVSEKSDHTKFDVIWGTDDDTVTFRPCTMTSRWIGVDDNGLWKVSDAASSFTLVNLKPLVPFDLFTVYQNNFLLQQIATNSSGEIYLVNKSPLNLPVASPHFAVVRHRTSLLAIIPKVQGSIFQISSIYRQSPRSNPQKESTFIRKKTIDTLSLPIYLSTLAARGSLGSELDSRYFIQNDLLEDGTKFTNSQISACSLRKTCFIAFKNFNGPGILFGSFRPSTPPSRLTFSFATTDDMHSPSVLTYHGQLYLSFVELSTGRIFLTKADLNAQGNYNWSNPTSFGGISLRTHCAVAMTVFSGRLCVVAALRDTYRVAVGFMTLHGMWSNFQLIGTNDFRTDMQPKIVVCCGRLICAIACAHSDDIKFAISEFIHELHQHRFSIPPDEILEVPQFFVADAETKLIGDFAGNLLLGEEMIDCCDNVIILAEDLALNSSTRCRQFAMKETDSGWSLLLEINLLDHATSFETHILTIGSDLRLYKTVNGYQLRLGDRSCETSNPSSNSLVDTIEIDFSVADHLLSLCLSRDDASSCILKFSTDNPFHCTPTIQFEGISAHIVRMLFSPKWNHSLLSDFHYVNLGVHPKSLVQGKLLHRCGVGLSFRGYFTLSHDPNKSSHSTVFSMNSEISDQSVCDFIHEFYDKVCAQTGKAPVHCVVAIPGGHILSETEGKIKEMTQPLGIKLLKVVTYAEAITAHSLISKQWSVNIQILVIEFLDTADYQCTILRFRRKDGILTEAQYTHENIGTAMRLAINSVGGMHLFGKVSVPSTSWQNQLAAAVFGEELPKAIWLENPEHLTAIGASYFARASLDTTKLGNEKILSSEAEVLTLPNAQSRELPMGQDPSIVSLSTLASAVVTCNLKIGSPPQLVSQVVIDTGSSDLWVNQKYYQPKNSITNSCDIRGNSRFRVTYGTGFVSGWSFADCVTIGESTATHHPIGVASIVSEDLIRFGVNGVVGLAYNSLSSNHQANCFTSTSSFNVLSTLVDQGIIHHDCFSIYVSKDGQSELVLGGYQDDNKHFTGSIIWTPITEKKYYTFRYDSISIGATVLCESGTAIADTGSSMFLGPTNSISAIFNAVQDPDFVMNIKVNGVIFSFTFPDLILDEKRTIGLAVKPSNLNLGSAEWIFGIPWFRVVFSIFDRSNSRLGFATSRRVPTRTNSTNFADTSFTEGDLLILASKRKIDNLSKGPGVNKEKYDHFIGDTNKVDKYNLLVVVCSNQTLSEELEKRIQGAVDEDRFEILVGDPITDPTKWQTDQARYSQVSPSLVDRGVMYYVKDFEMYDANNQSVPTDYQKYIEELDKMKTDGIKLAIDPTCKAFRSLVSTNVPKQAMSIIFSTKHGYSRKQILGGVNHQGMSCSANAVFGSPFDENMEWLHRIAFLYGPPTPQDIRVGETETTPADFLPQKLTEMTEDEKKKLIGRFKELGNFVAGTKQANEWMTAFEDTIMDTIENGNEKISVFVMTTTTGEKKDQDPTKDNHFYLWWCQKLVYQYRFYETGDPTKTLFSGKIEFDPFSRKKRLEALPIFDRCLLWKTLLPNQTLLALAAADSTDMIPLFDMNEIILKSLSRETYLFLGLSISNLSAKVYNPTIRDYEQVTTLSQSSQLISFTGSIDSLFGSTVNATMEVIAGVAVSGEYLYLTSITFPSFNLRHLFPSLDLEFVDVTLSYGNVSKEVVLSIVYDLHSGCEVYGYHPEASSQLGCSLKFDLHQVHGLQEILSAVFRSNITELSLSGFFYFENDSTDFPSHPSRFSRFTLNGFLQTSEPSQKSGLVFQKVGLVIDSAHVVDLASMQTSLTYEITLHSDLQIVYDQISILIQISCFLNRATNSLVVAGSLASWENAFGINGLVLQSFRISFSIDLDSFHQTQIVTSGVLIFGENELEFGGCVGPNICGAVVCIDTVSLGSLLSLVQSLVPPGVSFPDSDNPALSDIAIKNTILSAANNAGSLGTYEVPEGFVMQGEVSIRGHTVASARISISSQGFEIRGSVTQLSVDFGVLRLKDASLKLQYRTSLHPQGRGLSLSIDASLVVDYFGEIQGSFVYERQATTGKLEWAFFASLASEANLGSTFPLLKNVPLLSDVVIAKSAIMVASENDIMLSLPVSPFVRVKKGAYLGLSVRPLPQLSILTKQSNVDYLTLIVGTSKNKFEAYFEFSGTIDLGNGIQSTPIIVGVQQDIEVCVFVQFGITVPVPNSVLTFLLELHIGELTAEGIASMEGMWEDAFGIPGLSIGDITIDVALIYATFLTTGPSKVGVQGVLKIGDNDRIIMKGQFGKIPSDFILVGDYEGTLRPLQILSLLKALCTFPIDLDQIPQLFEFRQVSFSISMNGGQIQDFYFPPGFYFRGTILVMDRIPISVMVTINSDNLIGTGSVGTLQVGPVVVRGYNSPYVSVRMELSPKMIGLTLTGAIQLFGLANIAVSLQMNPDQYLLLCSVQLSGTNNFNFDLEVRGIILVHSINLQLEIALSGDIIKWILNFIFGEVLEGLEEAQEGLSKAQEECKAAEQKSNEAMKEAEGTVAQKQAECDRKLSEANHSLDDAKASLQRIQREVQAKKDEIIATQGEKIKSAKATLDIATRGVATAQQAADEAINIARANVVNAELALQYEQSKANSSLDTAQRNVNSLQEIIDDKRRQIQSLTNEANASQCHSKWTYIGPQIAVIEAEIAGLEASKWTANNVLEAARRTFNAMLDAARASLQKANSTLESVQRAQDILLQQAENAVHSSQKILDDALALESKLLSDALIPLSKASDVLSAAQSVVDAAKKVQTDVLEAGKITLQGVREGKCCHLCCHKVSERCRDCI